MGAPVGHERFVTIESIAYRQCISTGMRWKELIGQSLHRPGRRIQDGPGRWSILGHQYREQQVGNRSAGGKVCVAFSD